MADREQRTNGYIHETEYKTRIQTDGNSTSADTLALCQSPVLAYKDATWSDKKLIVSWEIQKGGAEAQEGKLGKERLLVKNIGSKGSTGYYSRVF